MLIALLACSTPDPATDAHEHAHTTQGEAATHTPHGHDLRDQASRVFAAVGYGGFDRWLGGDDTALTEQQKVGLKSFLTEGCAHCHAGPEFSSDGVPGLRGFSGEWPEHAGTDVVIRDFLSTI